VPVWPGNTTEDEAGRASRKMRACGRGRVSTAPSSRGSAWACTRIAGSSQAEACATRDEPSCQRLAVTCQQRHRVKTVPPGWGNVLSVRQGSHRQFKHPEKPGIVTVAGKAGIDVAPGTLNAILKQPGLKK
jgi:predicted RNA binding protein YcfA (HicA-like mRNA interferase family)